MGDDLASFFAKKTNKKDKKKKSGVISIEDVGNRLERKNFRYELEEFEEDENLDLVKLTKVRIEPMRVNNNSEDSEWIDFNDKPTFADLNIKELSEHEEENDDYGKVAKEPSKGWSNTGPVTVAEKEEVAKENTVVAPPKAYQPPGHRGMQAAKFPSLSAAPLVEKELKKIEEEQKIKDLEQKRRNEEIEKRREEERAKNNMRNGLTPGRQPYGGRGSQQNPPEKQENEGVDDWRSQQKPSTPKHQPVTSVSPQRVMSQTGQDSKPQANAISKVDEVGTWRRSTKPPDERQPIPAPTATEKKPESGKYVVPSKRIQNQ